MKRHFATLSSFALSTFLSLVAPLSSARAAFTTWGNVDPSNPSTWTSSTYGYVGETSAGTLTVDSGSLLSSYAYLGYGGSATGVVNISGTNSKWTNSNCLYIGDSGSGTLNITNGGSVSNSSTFSYSSIGNSSGSTGTVTVDGACSTWTNGWCLYVGESGSGMLKITGGGTVRNTYGYIGDWSGSNGTVTVDGSGSNWTNTYSLYVGNSGNGTLNITNGSTISNSDGCIGYDSGSTGVVAVSGAGSKWTNSGHLYVGCSGSGTLNIATGGAVSVVGTTYVGSDAGSTGAINFGANGGTLTTASLAASPSQLTGTGTINTCGLVSDIDLVFDSPNSLRQTFTFGNLSGQNVTINLDMASSPSANGALRRATKGAGL